MSKTMPTKPRALDKTHQAREALEEHRVGTFEQRHHDECSACARGLRAEDHIYGIVLNPEGKLLLLAKAKPCPAISPWPSILKESDAFEKAHRFGQLLPRQLFARHHGIGYAIPNCFLASGSYGATFTGRVHGADPVVIKIAWDAAEPLHGYNATGML
jgi:hypothetical protein